MADIDFDALLDTYKRAVDAWVSAIHLEESLATHDHSMKEMEKWDSAGLTIHDTEAAAKKARDAYKNALRRKNYGFLKTFLAVALRGIQMGAFRTNWSPLDRPYPSL